MALVETCRKVGMTKEDSKDVIKLPEELKADQSYSSKIGVGDQIDPRDVVSIAADFGIRQIVQNSVAVPGAELQTSQLMLERPSEFIANPLSSILQPHNVNQEEELKLRRFFFEFRSAREKYAVIDEIRAYVASLTTSEDLLTDVALAADELFTNAIYNAPHVKFEKNVTGAPRTSDNGNADYIRPSQIFIGHDKERLILGCADSYGTLNPEALVKKLKACFQAGYIDEVQKSTGGAGLGTYLIFQAASALYVAVDKGKRTVVCCSFTLDRKKRRNAALMKNLHLCSDEEEPGTQV